MNDITMFADTTFIMCAKLFLAALLGALLGTERAVLAQQAAGTRTFSLVAMGASMFIVIGNYVNIVLGTMHILPLAVAAAIITGIGFLGAGLIVFRESSLHGVTTAAALWIAAAVGIAVGFGMFILATFATIMALAIFTIVWYVENTFKHWFVPHENH